MGQLFVKYQRIILIGFRGVGKSTLAVHLQKATGWPSISSDAKIIQRENQSIPEIVAKKGWHYFREVETRVIENLHSQKNVIVDCGGGVVENERNMQLLQNDSLVVWVDAELSDILQRVAANDQRPLLNQQNMEEDLHQNYLRRQPLYEKYCHIKVNSSIQTAQEIVQQILLHMNFISE